MTVATDTTLSMAPAVDTPPDGTVHDGDAAITAPEAVGNAALAAVRTGNREAAQRIVDEMLPDERADLAGHLEDLRKLLGPTCADCGAPTGLGACTTDPFSAECRFLCGRCTTARRTPLNNPTGRPPQPAPGCRALPSHLDKEPQLMVLALFNRARTAPVEPPDLGPRPERGESWMPEGVNIVERHWNHAMSAIVLVYSTSDSGYHVVACLGCHFSVERDPDRGVVTGLKLSDANRIATEHATKCRALSRALPDCPDDATAREQLRKLTLSLRRTADKVQIMVSYFDVHRLTLQRSNEWIEAELRQLAEDRPDVFAVQRSDYSHTTFYVLPMPAD